MTASVITSGSWRFRRREFPGSHLRSWSAWMARGSCPTRWSTCGCRSPTRRARAAFRRPAARGVPAAQPGAEQMSWIAVPAFPAPIGTSFKSAWKQHSSSERSRSWTGLRGWISRLPHRPASCDWLRFGGMTWLPARAGSASRRRRRSARLRRRLGRFPCVSRRRGSGMTPRRETVGP